MLGPIKGGACDGPNHCLHAHWYENVRALDKGVQGFDCA